MAPGVAHAGVFNIPYFTQPEHFSLGLEPELTLTDGSGLGLNVKGTYGLNDLMNLQGTIGTGGGPLGFRIGAAAIFDFFPDLEDQPGIGLATQLMYYRVPKDLGLVDFRVIPYVHKSFKSTSSTFEPFIAFPIGFGILDGDSMGLSQLVLGSIFHSTESMLWSVELAVPINNTDTQFSGGVTFYF